MILRHPNRSRWTVIDNRILEDSRLSWEARGLLAFLLSKPDKWKVNVKHLENQAEAGRTKIRRILKELTDSGYLEYRKAQKQSGLFAGTEIVVHENPRVGFSDAPAFDPIVNTELKVITDNYSTEQKTNGNLNKSAAGRARLAEERIAAKGNR